jgi:hypothetical protein
MSNHTKKTRDELLSICYRLAVNAYSGGQDGIVDYVDNSVSKLEALLAQTKQETEKELKAKLIDALENHKRTLDYIVKDHAPKNATNYEVYLRKAIEVDVKIDKLSDTAHTPHNVNKGDK